MSGAHETEQVQRRTLLVVLALNALLFVGLQNEDLIFLDPHLVQEAANLEEEWIDCDDADLIEEAKKQKEQTK